MPIDKMGFLIAIEGIDGSGKTTLLEIAKNHLQSKGIDVFALPSGGLSSSEIEAQIREIVIAENNGITQETETLLYFSALAQKVGQHIFPALCEKKVVIVDRFILSTVVFSHYMLKQNRELIERMLAFASRNIMPDLTFLCDLEESVAYKRLTERGKKLSRREKQGIPLMQIMRNGYLNEIENTTKHFEVIRTDQVSIERMGDYVYALEKYIRR